MLSQFPVPSKKKGLEQRSPQIGKHRDSLNPGGRLHALDHQRPVGERCSHVGGQHRPTLTDPRASTWPWTPGGESAGPSHQSTCHLYTTDYAGLWYPPRWWWSRHPRQSLGSKLSWTLPQQRTSIPQESLYPGKDGLSERLWRPGLFPSLLQRSPINNGFLFSQTFLCLPRRKLPRRGSWSGENVDSLGPLTSPKMPTIW